jgi:hypothetical protein
MKTKKSLLLAVILAILGLSVFWLHSLARNRHKLSLPAATGPSAFPRPTTATNSSSFKTNGQTNSEVLAISAAFGKFADMMVKAGARKVGSCEDELARAINTGDRGEIIRAFDEAIYGYASRPSGAIAAFKKELLNADPFIRYLAAEHLYIVGDNSGFDALIGIVRDTTNVPSLDPALRQNALQTLAKYREKRAGFEIAQLFDSSGARNYITPLALLGATQSVKRIVSLLGPGDDVQVALIYGRLGCNEVTPCLEPIVTNINLPTATRASAAWALFQVTRESRYAEMLLEWAKATLAVPANGRDLDYGEPTKVFRFAASVPDARIRSLLEDCLSSPNQVLRQYSFVSLMLNQGGDSPKLKAALLGELNLRSDRLPLELLAQIASQSKDPEIRAAGFQWDKVRGEHFFENWAVRRKDWPVYSWAEDYAILK